MRRNEGTADRIVRLVIAAAAVIGAFAVGAGSVLGIVLFVVAAVMVVTAAIGFCPLYQLVGVNTCRRTVATR
jgi:zinc transporter ZupT